MNLTLRKNARFCFSATGNSQQAAPLTCAAPWGGKTVHYGFSYSFEKESVVIVSPARAGNSLGIALVFAKKLFRTGFPHSVFTAYGTTPGLWELRLKSILRRREQYPFLHSHTGHPNTGPISHPLYCCRVRHPGPCPEDTFPRFALSVQKKCVPHS